MSKLAIIIVAIPLIILIILSIKLLIGLVNWTAEFRITPWIMEKKEKKLSNNGSTRVSK